MLIDDEEVDQMLYGRIVERSEHVERIVSLTNANRALTHLREKKSPQPDLILLDINMPRMDGFEFLDALDENFDADDVPRVIMLTTSFNPEDEVRARASPLVCGFKSKPLTDKMLLEFRELMAKDHAKSA